MSLILDALRKADAERERGSVPSLHSQPVVSPSAGESPKPKVRPNWLWIAIGVALGLVAAATWVMIGRNAPAPSTATANVAPAQPSTSGATPARAGGDERPTAACRRFHRRADHGGARSLAPTGRAQGPAR